MTESVYMHVDIYPIQVLFGLQETVPSYIALVFHFSQSLMVPQC